MPFSIKNTMTQDEVKSLAEAAPLRGNKHIPAASNARPKRGDGSRYGKQHQNGVMNQTESEYSLILESRLRNGEILAWRFESMKLQLAARLTYRPDFLIVNKDYRLVFVDTKGAGPISETSLVKIKMSAKLFPWFQFMIEKKQSKADGGGWVPRLFPSN